MANADRDELQEKLLALNISLEGEFQNAIDSNADIVGATKKMAHNLLIIRNAYLAEADRIFEMVKALAESAHITAELLADLVAAEWGIEEFFDDDEDDEDEDDE